MKIHLVESDKPSRITFMGKKLSFYDKGIYYKTQISNPQNIVIVDEKENTIASSSTELTPNSIISDEDIKSIVEFYNKTGNLPDFYLFEQNI